jgi:hypothetical protein
MALGKSAAALLAAVVAWGTAADYSWAQDNRPAPAERMPTPSAAAGTATPRRPFMHLLDQAGVGRTLDEQRIDIFGHVEFGWTYNFDDPDSEINAGRFFDFEHNEPILDQLDFNIERKVDPSKANFDVGGRFELMWGADAGLIHANGLTDWYDGPRDPENQLDLTQLYIDFAVPVGNGLLVRVGKFVTIIGQEVINPLGNSLYSHSFLFTFAQPLTHTGIIASYNLNDQWSLSFGITRGWDQAWEDNNDEIDFLGSVKWAQSRDTTLILNFSGGPQRADNDDDWRWLFDLVAAHTVSDQLAIAVNLDIGFEEGAAVDGDDGVFWGIAGYGGFKITDEVGVNARAEWFSDSDGARTGIEDLDLFELTVGLNFKPFAKDRWGQFFQIRPEVRIDFASEDVFDDFGDDSQITFGVDAIFAL